MTALTPVSSITSSSLTLPRLTNVDESQKLELDLFLVVTHQKAVLELARGDKSVSFEIGGDPSFAGSPEASHQLNRILSRLQFVVRFEPQQEDSEFSVWDWRAKLSNSDVSLALDLSMILSLEWPFRMLLPPLELDFTGNENSAMASLAIDQLDLPKFDNETLQTSLGAWLSMNQAQVCFR